MNEQTGLNLKPTQETRFMGLDGFIWFVGVVEDRKDPEQMGRVRVRALGHHTEKLAKLPKDDLPWATVMSTTHDPSMNGLGETPPFLVEGTWVVGFFQDTIEKQHPIILGSLPGFNLEKPDFTKGFADPKGKYPRKVGEPDTNKLARGAMAEEHPSLKKRRKMRLTKKAGTDVPKSTKPFMEKTEDGASKEGRETWEEISPKSDTKSVYPFNHVHESEIGHVWEIDDTPGGERLHQYHNTGSFEEIHPKGDKMVKVVGDNYEVIMKDSNVYIEGNVNLTIGKTARTLIKGDYILEVEGDLTEKIHGNRKTLIKQNRYEEILGNYSYNINKNKNGVVIENFTTIIGVDEFRWIKQDFKSIINRDWTTIVHDDIIFTAQDTMQIVTHSGIMSIKSGSNLNSSDVAGWTHVSAAQIDIDGTRIDLN